MENKVSNQQSAAKKYIEENEIEKIVSEMLNSLVHEKSKTPVVHMIKYLAGLLTEEEQRQHNLVIPDPYPKGRPIVKFPSLQYPSLLKKFLTKPLWATIKYLKTRHGGNVMHLIRLSDSNPADKIGCMLSDADCLATFGSLLCPILNEVHSIGSEPHEFRVHSASSASNENFPYFERIADRIQLLKFSFARNLQDTPFACLVSGEKSVSVETAIVKAIDALVLEGLLSAGRFINSRDNKEEVKAALRDSGVIGATLDVNNVNNSNKGQVFITKDNSARIFINFVDHLHVINTGNFSSSIGGNTGKAGSSNLLANLNDFTKFYNSTFNLIKAFEKHINFEFDKFYGYINSYPGLIGAGLIIESEIRLAGADIDTVQVLTENMNFDFKETSASEGLNGKIFRTKSLFKLCYKSDLEFCEEYYSQISGLINLDKLTAGNNNPEAKLSNKLSKLEIVGSDDCLSLKRAYEEVYEASKFLISPSGETLNSLIGDSLTVKFTESADYKTFLDFTRRFLLYTQNFDVDLHDHIHKPDEPRSFIPVLAVEKLLSTRVRLSRNIAGLPFPCSRNHRSKEVGDVIRKTMDSMNLKRMSLTGRYTEDTEEATHKGVIHFTGDNNSGNCIRAIVNDVDHITLQIKIENSEDHQNLPMKFMTLLKLSNDFSKSLKFSYDKRLGFLTSDIRDVGTGMRVDTSMKLNMDEERLETILQPCGFRHRVLDRQEGIVQVSNKFTIGRSEADLLMSFIHVINEIVEKDKEQKVEKDIKGDKAGENESEIAEVEERDQ